MAVDVSLIDLVRVHGTRRLWPEEFDQLVKAIEENPDERSTYKAVSDWLGEHGEVLFARGFAYLAKRPEIEVKWNSYYKDQKTWSAGKLPDPLRWKETPDCDCSTLAGLVADIAYRIKAAVDELE